MQCLEERTMEVESCCIAGQQNIRGLLCFALLGLTLLCIALLCLTFTEAVPDLTLPISHVNFPISPN